MKIPPFLIVVILILCCVSTVGADVYVHGYYRNDGTYVAPHYRSDPDGLKWNNYGPKDDESTGLYDRDNDGDGIANQNDNDDDNDGISDDNDKSQY